MNCNSSEICNGCKLVTRLNQCFDLPRVVPAEVAWEILGSVPEITTHEMRLITPEVDSCSKLTIMLGCTWRMLGLGEYVWKGGRGCMTEPGIMPL